MLAGRAAQHGRHDLELESRTLADRLARDHPEAELERVGHDLAKAPYADPTVVTGLPPA